MGGWERPDFFSFLEPRQEKDWQLQNVWWLNISSPSLSLSLSLVSILPKHLNCFFVQLHMPLSVAYSLLRFTSTQCIFWRTGVPHYSQIHLFALAKIVKMTIFQSKMFFIHICELKIRGPKWWNVSTANNEGNLYLPQFENHTKVMAEINK